ncbi:MAG: carboxypeptidase regulatory-like domain-containing protein [Acidobacteria bacterium]|nr:carboxypeptidase regulatory-like domain-containing protein [Acidobacteriota bacterium]
MRKALVSWIAFCAAVWGQTTRTVIAGTVTDLSGAMVSGADVAAMEQSTGITSPTQTGAEGQYTLTNFEPGTYKITVTAHGSQRSTVRDVTLQVNQTARVDIGLKDGEVSTRKASTGTAGSTIVAWRGGQRCAKRPEYW